MNNDQEHELIAESAAVPGAAAETAAAAVAEAAYADHLPPDAEPAAEPTAPTEWPMVSGDTNGAEAREAAVLAATEEALRTEFGDPTPPGTEDSAAQAEGTGDPLSPEGDVSAAASAGDGTPPQEPETGAEAEAPAAEEAPEQPGEAPTPEAEETPALLNPGRDLNAEFGELVRAHPELDGTMIPQDIFEVMKNSERSVLAVYDAEMLKRANARISELENEVAMLRQNAETALRAPIVGSVGGSANDAEETDFFLRGFNHPIY